MSRKPEMLNQRLGVALRIGASLALLAGVLWWANPREVAAKLVDVSLLGLLSVVLLHTGDRLLMAYKWRRLLRARDLPIGLGEAIRAYYVSSFAGMFLPMTVGADLVRLGAMRRSEISSSNMVASIAIERALGAVSQALFCLLSLGLIAGLRLKLAIPFTGLAALVGAMVVVLTLAMPLSFRLAAIADERWSGRQGLLAKLAGLAREYAAWQQHPREIWLFLLLTLLEGFFPIITYVAAAWALGVPTTVVEMTAVVPIVYLFARLPVSLGGLGAEQVGFVAAAALVGIGTDSAAAVSFLVVFALLVALVPGALAWLLARGEREPDSVDA